MHDPRVKDFRKFCNHFEVTWTWPLSYCHGWGAGLVPLAQRHLLGLAPVAPGWASLALAEPPRLPMAFQATVPTPQGTVSVSRDDSAGPLRYVLPPGMELAGEIPAESIVEKRNNIQQPTRNIQ